MERQTEQMVRLIDDLLDVSRITRGKLQIRMEQTTLAKVLQIAVDAVRPLIDAAGHQLTVTLPDEPLVLEADASRLAQVVANLLNNAAKYTPSGGCIWLTAIAKETWRDFCERHWVGNPRAHAGPHSRDVHAS